jgi:hypothetical protein
LITIDSPRHGQALPVDARTLAATICRDADDELRQLLPGLPPDIVVSCSLGTHVVPGIGCGATAMDSRTIALVVKPSSTSTVEQILRDHLRHLLFHECHHLVRGWVRRGGMRRRHFIDGVICEGLASAFERDAAGHAAPWCEYPEDVRAWVDELLALPLLADYRHWMFHHPDGRQWIGYKAGTYITDRAIARSGLDAATLVSVPAERILELAGLPQP